MKKKIVYKATDSDGDAIGGSFSATVSSTQQTSLDLSSALTSTHFDHLMKPDTGERVFLWRSLIVRTCAA